MSTWNTKTAEWYAENYGEYATNKLAVSLLNLCKHSIVVDIGCGTGSALRHASEIITDAKLIGIDPVPRMIEIARENTKNHHAADRIDYYLGTAENLPIENIDADFVFAFDSFDHWNNQQEGLKEVSRIISRNGFFVVVKDGGLPEGDNAKITFIKALSENGFEIIEEQCIEDNDVSFTLWICKLRA